jgi:hypothetical protein
VKDRCEEATRDGDLRHLEDHVPGMLQDLRADLYGLLPKRRQRPVLDAFRQRQPAQEIAQVVRQGEQWPK